MNKSSPIRQGVVRIKIETPISSDDIRKFVEALSSLGIEIEITFSTKSMIIILPNKMTDNQMRNEVDLR